jgi:hypothetical protein
MPLSVTLARSQRDTVIVHLHFPPIDQLPCGLESIGSGLRPARRVSTRLDRRVERAISQARPGDRAAHDLNQIRMWLVENTVTVQATDLAWRTIKAEDVLNIVQGLERSRQRLFSGGAVFVVNNQRDIGAQRPRLALDSRKGLRKDSRPAEEAACSDGESDEATSIHGD